MSTSTPEPQHARRRTDVDPDKPLTEEPATTQQPRPDVEQDDDGDDDTEASNPA